MVVDGKLDLSNFNTSKVTDMQGMFVYSDFDSITLDNFDTSKVTNMSGMFASADIKSLDLSSFDTSRVTDMRAMFFETIWLRDLNISGFNTCSVTNMESMFEYCMAYEIDVSGFNTSNVTTMRRMFWECRLIDELDVSNFNTSKVTDMCCMFGRLRHVTELDLRSFNTSRVTDMSYMFKYDESLNKIYATANFATTNVTNSTDMFTGCTSINGGSGTTYDANHVDKLYARLDGINSNRGYFYNVCRAKYVSGPYFSEDIKELAGASNASSATIDTAITAIEWQTEKPSDATLALARNVGVSAGDYVPIYAWFENGKIKLYSVAKISMNEDMSGMFRGLKSLTSIDPINDLGITEETTNVTVMNSTFAESGITSANLSDAKFNTSNVTGMASTFQNSALTSFNKDDFEFNSVQNMEAMFYGTKLTIVDLANVSFPELTILYGCFQRYIDINYSRL